MSWLDGLQPWLRPYAQALVQLAPWVRITSTFRTLSEQERLYRRFLAGQAAYPVAPPGRSYHNYGRAWDMVADDETLRRLGAVWTSWGGTWHESDNIHFQA